jgi:hypothetical protein
MVSALRPQYSALISVLERAGFTCVVQDYRPDVFGNFVALCSSPNSRVRITNDRGQIFVDVATLSGPCNNKEEILESIGIPRERHETLNGLWSGYEPAVQASELERYLAQLIAVVSNGAA